MIYAALSSSTLIGADVKTVLLKAAEVGAQGIEWTDDEFVRSGDLKAAGETMMATLRAGLCTVSYATAYRPRGVDPAAFGSALATARSLNAPVLRLRFDAGGASDPVDPAALAGEIGSLADEAGSQGVTLCLSLPSGAATGPAAALAAVDHPFVRLAWEPAPRSRFDEVMNAFLPLSGRVGLLVVAAVELAGPAEDRSEEWLQYLDAYDEQGGSPDMARAVVIRCAEAGDERGLECAVAAVKSWSVTLRRYHQRRVY